MKQWKQYSMAWMSVGLALIFWFMEPAIQSLILDNGSFADNWLNPDPDELRVRIIVVFLILLLGVYAQAMIRRQQMTLSKLHEHSQMLRQIVDTTKDAFISMDASGLIIDWNPQAERIFGWTRKEALGQQLSNMVIPAHLRQEHEQGLERFLSTNTTAFLDRHIETTAVHKDGREFPVELSVASLASGDSHIFNGFVRDISERKEVASQLEQLANRDALTGLPNRSSFNDLLHQAVALALRRKHKLVVMFLDLDEFKSVNDSLGHDIGDMLLQESAKRLLDCLRDSDAVARVGGDEFLILLSDVQQDYEPQYACERIIDAFSRPFDIDGHECFVGVSIGISIYPADGDNVEALVKNADTAMYRAKAAGKNNFKFYTSAMGAEVFKRMEMERALRHAMDEGQLRLLYQPQVDSRTGQIVGVEALMRWQHPDLGAVSPAIFIPLAEQTKLILPIGQWALQSACRQNKAWQDMGLPPVRVAVNFAARQFADDSLIDIVAGSLRESGLAAEYLEVEITEGSAMHDVDVSIEKMQALRKLGVSISIDDFGTGFSSLTYLKRFPISTLKIDKSFLDEIPGESRDAAIVTTISEMAHNLGMKVVAEGVEKEQQVAFLRNQGCDVMQGFLFSLPVGADEIAEMLKKGSKLAGVQQELGSNI